ncbi:hypothetical protein Pint_25512 [Pistacia integerrima]|uniref:Uncharacterized protein n=2 Tax=Pistacia TaxID=55512 RepID=A0ACC1B5C1_9ROSI|nr:hypothetical protein Pint_25512 [Pistacia integerrima]KAJ0094013.1 hypothetical protein Patl1_26080 [Pistacia atlantica]
MEDQVIFSKHLSETDVNWRLAVPTHCLGLFDPILQGSHSVALVAIDATTGHVWPFRLSARTKGHHLRLVLAAAGWLAFVRYKKLRIDDKITFSVANLANGMIYKIKSSKKD